MRKIFSGGDKSQKKAKLFDEYYIYGTTNFT